MAIYSAQHKTLHELLTIASSNEATLLIPDLQRPYVWTPKQVLDLIDSLFKGWPFGTLLLWSLGPVNQDEHLIPSRPFWALVDRIDNNGDTFQSAHRPNDFLMVLDGQQRLQSLLLAFACDSAGMKLLDRDWKESLEGKSPYHGANAKKHWTVGHLYLDLFSLREQLIGDEDDYDICPNPDFSKLLIWGWSGQQDEQNTLPIRPNGYESLPNITAQRGRFIRLSRLWNRAVAAINQDDPTLKTTVVMPVLVEHQVDDDLKKTIWRALRSFVKKLQSAQKQEVHYLQLNRLEQSGYLDPEQYNEAIVNIFTRLNSAGRTLTREEITFAWVKVVWPEAVNEIEKLRRNINATDENLRLGSDAIVKILSIAWSVFERGGRPVRDRDLLDGRTVRELAEWLKAHWQVISPALAGVASFIQNLGLKFNLHYRSINAFTLLAIWRLSYELWVETYIPTGQNRDILLSNADLQLENQAESWMIFSQWAGKWAQRTDDTVEAYMRSLATCWQQGNILQQDAYHELMIQTLASWLTGLKDEALRYIDKLEVDDRARVSTYRVAINLWQREDTKRAAASKVVLCALSTRRQPDIEVDHIVPWSRWEQMTRDNKFEDARIVGNSIGNCSLLTKTFNVTKNAKSLDEWLQNLKPITNFDSDQWKRDMWIPKGMADLDADSKVNSLVRLIKLREKKIKEDLKNIIVKACTPPITLTP